MYLYSLLEVSEQTTDIVKWISVGGVVLVLAIIALIGFFRNKRFDAKKIAFAGICVSMSFTLAIIKFSPVQYGGSITIASFVPILIFAYAYGVIDGLLIGLIHGLLNFIEDPYILTPATLLFDYLLAFMSVGLMGFFGKMRRKERGCLPIVLGCVAVFTLRFVSHLLSGMIFFSEGAVWVSFPDWAMGNAFIYSFIYQCIYVPADALIATLALIAFCKSGVLDKLLAIIRPKNAA
ncbi:MAG: energy-coupled thiamine transporter ThiT [Clostridia bacterium]|nr:energy-coupled thiamine transporter ThiT [Clostridia bacterium]